MSQLRRLLAPLIFRFSLQVQVMWRNQPQSFQVEIVLKVSMISKNQYIPYSCKLNNIIKTSKCLLSGFTSFYKFNFVKSLARSNLFFGSKSFCIVGYFHTVRKNVLSWLGQRENLGQEDQFSELNKFTTIFRSCVLAN